MAFLAQKLIHIINIWFNFVPGSFFGQYHPSNLIILGVYAKRWPKCERISRQKLIQHKIWSKTFFFLTLAVRRHFHKKEFKWKKYGSTGPLSEKTEKRKLSMQNLTKEWKQPPLVIRQKSIFYNIFIRCLWLRIIERSDQGV